MTDVLDIIKDEVLSPRTLLRAVSFMGWPVMLASYLPGALSTAAEVAIHTAPGVLQGESFGDAFVAEYGWRLKLAASHLTGLALAEASAAAAQVLAGTGDLAGLGISTAIEDKLKEAVEAAKQELGDKAVAELKKQAESLADKRINEAFKRVTSDPRVAEALKRAPELELRSVPNLRDIARELGVRQDVAALAINALRKEHLFVTTPDKFSIATGEYIGPVQGREQDGDVLVPIVVEDSGAFAETPDQRKQREAVEHGLAVLADQRSTERVVRAAGITLAPLALVWLLRGRR